MKRKDHLRITFPGLIVIILFFSAGMTSSCRAQKEIIDMEKLADVKWVHSHEEDKEGYEVYRPESYDFPPSRGRRGFKFLPQNDFINFEIAPTDGIITRDGKWEIGEQKQCLIKFEDNPEKNYAIQIIEQRKKLLKVKIIHH